jgi:O-antigen/teichoic acid export membrane protein
VTSSPHSPSLTSRSVQGIKWTYFAAVASLAVQLPYTVAINRLLSPGDFGVVAVSLIIARLVSYLAQGGVASALVQRPHIEAEDVRAGITLSILGASSLVTMVWLAAPRFAAAVHVVESANVIRAVSLGLACTILAATPLGLLRRSMRFRALACLELITYALGYCGIGLLVAALGGGAWSLAAAVVAQSLMSLLGAYALTRHTIVPSLNLRRARALAKWGVQLSVLGLAEYVSLNIDSLAVARFGGAGALGQYNRAWLVTALPMQQTATAATKVFFPAFSRAQGEGDRLRAAYTDALAALALVLLPIAAVIAVSAGPGVEALLGEQWGLAASIVPVLAAATALDTVIHLPAVMLESLGRLIPKLIIQAAYLVTVVGCLILVVSYGMSLLWYATAVLVAQLIRHALYLAYVQHVLHPPGWTIIRIYAESLGTAAGLAVVAAISGSLMSNFADSAVLNCAARAIAVTIAAVALVFAMPGMYGISALHRRGVLRIRPRLARPQWPWRGRQ